MNDQQQILAIIQRQIVSFNKNKNREIKLNSDEITKSAEPQKLKFNLLPSIAEEALRSDKRRVSSIPEVIHTVIPKKPAENTPTDNKPLLLKHIQKTWLSHDNP